MSNTNDFEIVNGVLKKYTGEGGDVVIPEGVTKIGWGAFENCTSLTSVKIPGSVTEIEIDAFKNCASLTSAKIPDSVTYINGSRFSGCTSLTEIIVGPDHPKCKSIDGILYEDDGEKLTFCPGGKTSITISDRVTKINSDAFDFSASLMEITVYPNNPGYQSIDGVLYSKDGKTLVACPSRKTSVNIPDCVTKIYSRAFINCSAITSLIIPDSVKEIGSNAFHGCTSLTDVIIPDSVTRIEGSAFSGCASLRSVVIPNSVTEIKSSAFLGCTSLASVTIPDCVTEIGWQAFYQCTSLETVKIGNKIKKVEDDAFKKCNIKNLYLGLELASVINICIFSPNFLPEYIYPEYIVAFTLVKGLSTIAEKARFVFKGSIANITIKDLKVKAIAEVMRKNPEAPVPDENEKALINDFVNKNIGLFANVLGESEAFEYAKENGILTLKNIDKLLATSPSAELSVKLKTYSEETFSDSQRTKESAKNKAAKEKADIKAAAGIIPVAELKKLWRIKDIDSMSVEIFGYKGTTDLAEVPSTVGKKDVVRLRGSSDWTEVFGNMKELVIPYGVREIDSGTFAGCKSLTKVTIPGSVTKIGYWAFKKCTALTSVTIGDGVTEICEEAFSFTGLTTISIPNSVTSIGTKAFFGCSKLTSISIPKTVTSIGKEFKNWTGITTITVDEGNSVFQSINNCLINKETKTLIAGCDTSVIPDDGSVTSIESNAFSNCMGLTSVTIPNSVTTIGNSAFSGCAGLTSITIPDSVTTIGNSAFSNCTGLTSITIPGSVTSIGYFAFDRFSSIKIHAPEGSYAEKYANANNIPFEKL